MSSAVCVIFVQRGTGLREHVGRALRLLLPSAPTTTRAAARSQPRRRNCRSAVPSEAGELGGLRHVCPAGAGLREHVGRTLGNRCWPSAPTTSVLPLIETGQPKKLSAAPSEAVSSAVCVMSAQPEPGSAKT